MIFKPTNFEVSDAQPLCEEELVLVSLNLCNLTVRGWSPHSELPAANYGKPEERSLRHQPLGILPEPNTLPVDSN